VNPDPSGYVPNPDASKSMKLIYPEEDFPMEISRAEFLSIKCVDMNPLKHRLAECFEFGPELTDSISFTDYMVHSAAFNRGGNRVG
jgi:hypothetical protein